MSNVRTSKTPGRQREGGDVLQLRCTSSTLFHFRILKFQGEELNILYKKSLVSIDGFSLFQSLRACRNHVARGTTVHLQDSRVMFRNLGFVTATASGGESIQPPPLAYKKWSLYEHEFVSDQCTAGKFFRLSGQSSQTKQCLCVYV